MTQDTETQDNETQDNEEPVAFCRLEQAVRDLITAPRRQQQLLQDKARWFQLCSSLDAIGDTQLALEAYSVRGLTEDTGANYLLVYGALQILFVQQEAIFDLCNALAVPKDLSQYPKLKEIRELRNDSTGHPTRRDGRKGQPDTHHFISRISISQQGFDLLSHSGGGNTRMRYVNLLAAIADQDALIKEILGDVLEHLEAEEAAHREEFRMAKLTDVFPETLAYGFEKLNAAITDPDERPLGQWGMDHVGGVFSDFRAALERRGMDMDTYIGVRELYREVEYPLRRLTCLFHPEACGEEDIIDSSTAGIFSFFLSKKISELRVIAAEIDGDYSG